MLEDLQNLNLSHEIIVLIISALPIAELRVAIPVAINSFGFPWYYALLLAFIGNLLPVPFILLFIKGVVKFLRRFRFFDRFFNWLFDRTEKRSGVIRKYGSIGLTLFVGIPLPITGAWTGSLAAVLLDLPFWRSLLAITIGVIIAGVIVTVLSLMGWIGAIIAGVVLATLAVLGFWKV